MRILFLLLTTFPLLINYNQERSVSASDLETNSGNNKSTLLIFIGSDWCLNCRRLEKNVLTDSTFIRFRDENLTMQIADFPQRKKLSKEVVKKNEALAEKYQFKGVFPTIILIGPSGELITEITYQNQNANEFISQLKKHL